MNLELAEIDYWTKISSCQEGLSFRMKLETVNVRYVQVTARIKEDERERERERENRISNE